MVRAPTNVLTFNLCNRVGQDILLCLLIFDARHDLVNDTLDEFSLFALLCLLFKADPGIEDRLEFCGQRDFLALNKGFRFELSGLLYALRQCCQNREGR